MASRMCRKRSSTIAGSGASLSRIRFTAWRIASIIGAAVGYMGCFRAASGAPWWRETVAWLDALARPRDAQNV
uniref:Uncharacterized protein n=1 Tax=Ralstonia solanacearum TaxID=305 RepID=A0A0S4UDQ6_RALSL|nr:conserved exported protein of unknown function [Ralstonia solanacearum]